MAVVDPTRGDASLNLVMSLENLGKWLMAGAVFFALTGACIVLAKLMYRFDQVYGFYALFDLGSDSSIPTWFSSLGLLACSLLLWTHSLVEDPAQRLMCWQWRFLALVFLLLSVDEVARIHEVLGTFVGQELVPDVSDRSGGLLSYQWLVCGVIFTSAIALAYIPFLYRLPRRVALGFILAGGIYVGGAVVMESFNGHTEYTAGPRSALYLWGTALEEFLEMVGVALFAGALVRYLSQRLDVLSVSTNFDNRQ